ncbi:hypothetical protein P9436_16500 [Lysinibacillus capsici]|uniref:hypothetical protein n=1 Tax=Lysinibacillus capsici TaxID=2115968 RepID=UPI0001DA516B|nr:hypothetical protein [Lysinibacillus capsici]EFI70287.1 hypothetical protein BFZC1_02662 [Lysinibacillus fusiformis ZC1]EKU44902.1 hypothetical protein C518_0508 [Lysinibacillus fusiformis ZB2]MED4700660.1 hypothetical protein [Lysinibacillus capsici]
MDIKFVKFEVLLPEESIEHKLGVLTVGHYDHVVSYTVTKGYWRPLNKAVPFNGKRGEIPFGTECNMEFKCLYAKINEVKKVIRKRMKAFLVLQIDIFRRVYLVFR